MAETNPAAPPAETSTAERAPATAQRAVATAESAAETPRPSAVDNRIPYSRVKEMQEKTKEKIRSQYEKEIEELKRRIDELTAAATPGDTSAPTAAAGSAKGSSEAQPQQPRGLSLLAALMSSPPRAPRREAPRHPGGAASTSTARSAMEADLDKAADRFLAHRESRWNAFVNKHSDVLQKPAAAKALQALFSAAFMSGEDPIRAVLPIVEAYRAQAREEKRQQKEDLSRRVVPAGRGGGGGPAGRKKPKIGNRSAPTEMQQKIMQGLAAQRRG